jgi:hypothetical protein
MHYNALFNPSYPSTVNSRLSTFLITPAINDTEHPVPRFG